MSDIVVPPAWVADHLDDIAVVDVREAWEFEGIGHVPGAVNVPFDAIRGEGPDSEQGEAGHLPGADRFAEVMSEAGIANGDDVLAYDDTHGVFAARFLVTAELYGHDRSNLHLLNGDYSAYQRGFPVESEIHIPQSTDYHAAFDESGPLIGMDEVQDALDDEDAVIVDTREPWEYDEGHIPGAVQLDWRELVDDESRGLEPEAELRDILEERGITPDKRVVLYCNTARRISHTYVVLRYLDYEDVSFYEGSLTEWEARGGELV